MTERCLGAGRRGYADGSSARSTSTRTSRSAGRRSREVCTDEARPARLLALVLAFPAPPTRIRSATSRSTATAGSSSRGTASTCTTSSTSPRSRAPRRATVFAGPTHRSPRDGLGREEARRPARAAQAARRGRPRGRRPAGLETSSLRGRLGRGRGRRGSLAFRDENYSNRRGWREVVVHAERGAQLESSSVPATSSGARAHGVPPAGSPSRSTLPRQPLPTGRALSPATPPAVGELGPGGTRDVGLRVDRRARAHARLRAAVARAGRLLGRRPRARRRSREGDRRRLPRRHSGHGRARARCSARS